MPRRCCGTRGGVPPLDSPNADAAWGRTIADVPYGRTIADAAYGRRIADAAYGRTIADEMRLAVSAWLFANAPGISKYGRYNG